MDIANDTTIRKTDNFVETVVDDELVLLHIVNGQFYSLKDTGRRAWELLEDEKQFGSLVNAMCGEYDVAEETCRSELGKLFGELQERTLVELN
ncbi:PqqD family protein [Aurantiacibacter sediminis]|uniref:PqqD family protein n=1 Tax=Aurantiacibacter sediminis TaxID=2793064 RepID=A0ABS0N5U6_9SPHN|nr:PqqD family protein [Aurantiacibacter sediminis]MBH5323162.1 PqqD family protein [Aurantiacibacter sediminis]